jgi:hypothetical protein
MKDKHIPIGHRNDVLYVDKSILDLWNDAPGSELNATRIVSAMVEKGIAKHRTLRHLRRLVENKALVKRNDTRQVLYTLRVKSSEFDQIEYVRNLESAVSKNGMSYRWGVGGGFSHMACGTIVGFPELQEDSDPDVNFVVGTLLESASKIFVDLEYLRDILILRRAGVRIKLPETVLRDLILMTHVKALDHELGETKEVARKLLPSLSYWKEIVELLWKSNNAELPDPADPNEGMNSMTFTQSFEKLLPAKNYLKEEGLDISRYSLQELADKFRRMEEKTEEYTTTEFEKMDPKDNSGLRSVLLPKEMSEQHSLIGLGYAVKLAELFASKGLHEKQDLALVITRNPRTMDTQTTDEQILLEFIEAAKEHNPEIHGLSEEETARYLGRMFGEVYVNVSRSEIDALRNRPSLKQALAGHMESFYQEYHVARDKMIRFEEEIDRETYSDH